MLCTHLSCDRPINPIPISFGLSAFTLSDALPVLFLEHHGLEHGVIVGE